MGLIIRQTLKSTIYSYIGVIIGFVTVGILMPKYLTPAEIGVRWQIQSYATFISSFLAFGIPQSIIRMYPYFKNSSNKNHGILTLIILIVIISSLLFVSTFHFFGAYLLKSDIENSAIFKQFYSLIIPFTIATLLFIILDNYATAVKESTIGFFVKDVVLRVFIIILLIGYILSDTIDYQFFISTYTYLQYIPIIFIITFLFKKKLFPLTSLISFPSSKIKFELISVSLFNWINVLSGVAIISIDSIMLSKMTDSSTVGIYTTVFFFAGLILIPAKSMGKITNSIIADHFKHKNMAAVKSIYKKSAFAPLILGLFLFWNLLLAIPFIFNIILKSDFKAGIWVMIIMAFSNLVKMGSGVKYMIISNSKSYKWTTAFLIGFVILLIGSNLILIPKYGITGAAIASLLSNLIYHAAGVLFVKYKFNLSPFDNRFIQIIAFSTILVLILYTIPDFGLEIISSLIKAGLFSILFIIFIWKSAISPEISGQIDKVVHFLGNSNKSNIG